jgi:surfeit locus 1 family protein
MSSTSFRPGFWLTGAVALAMAVLLGLGSWQVQRLQWKTALISEREARLDAPAIPLPAASEDWQSLAFRQVTVRGEFRHDLEQLFGASAMDNRVGHHLLTPLIREDGRPLLIDRGWVPAGMAHPATRRDSQIDGEVEISGIARYRGADEAGYFTPPNQPEKQLWYSYDLEAMRSALGLDLLQVVIEADASGTNAPPVGGRTQVTLVNNHHQYAVTGNGLAAGLLAVYIAYGLRRGRPEV